MLLDIDAAFEAAITAEIGEPIHWPGRAFDPDPNVGHVRVQIGGQDRRSTSIGAGSPKEWNGVLYLVVVEPVAGGRRGANARAKQVADFFPRGRTLVSGAAKVIVYDTSIPPPISKADTIEVPVTVYWSCTEP